MTRPKVDPEKRQRTAQACDSCKRRKQKCNGAKPCNTCSKRGSTCAYGEYSHDSDDQPSPRRRRTDPASSGASSPLNGPHHHFNLQSSISQPNPSQELPRWIPTPTTTAPPAPPEVPAILQPHESPMMKAPISLAPVFSESAGGKGKETLNPVDQTSHLFSRGSTVSGQDEIADVHSNTRMLQDPRGRLLYVGDSATLSFLQLIRMIVDNVAGPSAFTMDPRRHRIVENTVSLPQNIRRTHLLPDRQTAGILVDAFFTNTNGLIELFHRRSFLSTLDICYADPLNIDPSWLCLLYLTFAIGLATAMPSPDTLEYAIIDKLRREPVDRAELFYADAQYLNDPLAGFEDNEFWSIQALTLMSLYMLTVSKRNAAYALFGMAVRSAFALGLHREETMCIFSGAHQMERRNLWRSLYVLDRFISASLGRPTSIRESDCSGDTLTTSEKPPFPQAPFPTVANAGFTGTLGLEATVRSSHVIGVILEKVYSQRKISTKLAQEIVDQCKGWPRALDPSLHWRQANSADPNQGIAILHVNLFYCHSIVLLTRPFFLHLMHKTHQERRETGQRPQRQGTRMEKFGEACVVASCHSIVLVQNAFEGHYLPNRDPFVLYFLFASALIVLSNEFSSLFENSSATFCISNAVQIMHFLADLDPQANRLLFILTAFRDVVVRQNATASQGLIPATNSQAPLNDPAPPVLGDSFDPIGDLFMDRTSAGRSTVPATAGPSNPLRRHSSGMGISPRNPSASLNRIPSSSTNHIQSDTPNNSFQTDTNLGQSPSSNRGRQNSLDTFLDLARVSSHSGEVPDSFGGDEIEFESLWQWSNANTTGLTPSGSGMGLTPGGSIGIVGAAGQATGVSQQIDVQGVSDSSVPLFGLSSAELGGG